jgi:hypothetical protein
LCACGHVGTGAVLAAITYTITYTISAAIPIAVSIYLAWTVISGKRAGNAGAVQDQSNSCQEQDQCNYWIFIHHLSSNSVSTLTLQKGKTPFFLFIVHCDSFAAIAMAQTQFIYSRGSVHFPIEVEE